MEAESAPAQASLQRSMAKTRALDVDTWKLRYKPQDKPGLFWQGVVLGDHVVLLEHTSQGQTRAREVTLDGRVPRRSAGVPGRILAARACAGRAIVLLDEGRLHAFDPEAFAFEDLPPVDTLADALTISPSLHWCYAGSTGTMSARTTVLSIASARTWELPFAPPQAAITIASSAGVQEEWWLHVRERMRRRVRLSEEGPHVQDVVEEPLLAGVEHLTLLQDVAGGPVLYTLGHDSVQRTHDILDMRPAQRVLRRLGWREGQWHVEATRESAVHEVVGLTSQGRLVVLERTSEVIYDQGSVYVRLLDAASLQPVAARYLAKSGPYELPLLIAPDALLLFGRKLGVGVHRAHCVRWGAPTPSLQIAEVRVSV